MNFRELQQAVIKRYKVDAATAAQTVKVILSDEHFKNEKEVNDYFDYLEKLGSEE